MHGKIGETPSAPFAELFDSLTKSHLQGLRLSSCHCTDSAVQLTFAIPLLRYARFETAFERGQLGGAKPRRMQSPSPKSFSREISVGFHIVPIPGGDACDFCAAHPVFRLYSCLNFPFNGRTVFARESSNGAWAACRKCAELVDAGRWSEVTDRAFRKFAQKHGPVSRYQELPLREQFRELHRRFR